MLGLVLRAAPMAPLILAFAATFCETWLTPEQSINEAQVGVATALCLKCGPLAETLVYPTPETLADMRARGLDLPHAELWTVHGIPKHVVPLDHEGTVFRHYAPLDAIAAIMTSGRLQTSYLSYEETAPGLYRKVYPDLAGAFLTYPGVRRQSIGVDARDTQFGYVDLTVSSQIPVLQIEQDILLVPLVARTRNWIAQYYMDRESGTLSPYNQSTYGRELDELAARGGPNLTPAAIPVQIIGHSAFP